MVSGDLHIEHIGAVLVNLGYNMELGEESILMSTMNSRSRHHVLKGIRNC